VLACVKRVNGDSAMLAIVSENENSVNAFVLEKLLVVYVNL
jgi:hypothetical protein